MDRNQLEQEALRQLNLGSHEGALKAYGAILRLDPRDRRIRQKVGELLLKLGRPAEAEKHFREIAEALVKEGNHRAAVALLKQLVALKADDPVLHWDLAECYASSGYGSDARNHFDMAMRLWIGAGRAMDASKCARRLAELSPGEPALRLKVAELLEAAGDPIGAATVYQEVADEYRRRGRPDEVGRVAEMALRLRPDDVGLLLDAAAARVEGGDPRKALTHLQQAFGQGPREPRTLDLLARAFEGAGQPEKALKVLVELSRVAAESGDAALEADALRRALRHTADSDLQARLAAAEERVSRLERRLTQLTLAQPRNEAELRGVVRAEVFQRYGLLDRAESALDTALREAPDAPSLIAARAELEVLRGRRTEAVALATRLLPGAAAETEAVQERIVLLGGGKPRPPEAAAKVAAPPSQPAAVATSPSSKESPDARGDRLLAAGDLDGAMAAYREAVAANPLDESVVAKIAALRALSRETAPVEDADPFADPTPLEDGTFSEVNPDALEDMAEPDLDEARSMVAVGMWSEALLLLGDSGSLDAAVLRAQATRGMGDAAGAMELLRDAVNDAAEEDPAYLDALFELSFLYTANGKARAAMRLLEEVRDLDASFRSAEVEARLRGIQKILK